MDFFITVTLSATSTSITDDPPPLATTTSIIAIQDFPLLFLLRLSLYLLTLPPSLSTTAVFPVPLSPESFISLTLSSSHSLAMLV
jgi:hypothetical protein